MEVTVMDITHRFSSMALVVLLLAGGYGHSCKAQSREAPALSSRSAPAASTGLPLLLGAGDRIDIQVFETPELSVKARVDQSGKVALPIGGQLEVEGLTPAQAALAVEKLLREEQVMLSPHVTILVDEYATQGVTLLGEVRSPGTYTLVGPRSLYEVLSLAGGVTQNEGSSITISSRRDPDHPTKIQVSSPNFSEIQRSTIVRGGDTVVVAKADMIFVVGDVGHPGAFYLQNGEPLSVLNALAFAAGLNHTAAGSKASIVRRTEDGARVIPVNVDHIMKNSEPNVIMAASDILVIPRSGAKVLLETALPGATAAVTGAVSTALVLR
jgi:polysaccharide export outer membrane protein